MPETTSKPRIKVLIIDDSPVIRQLLTHVLQADPAIEVVGTAVDPFDARRKLIDLRPDVLTLDIEMPRMDGLTFLAKLMEHYPTPTVVISTLTGKRSAASLQALELGAIDAIEKPTVHSAAEIAAFGDVIRRAVKAARAANMGALCHSTQLAKRAVAVGPSATAGHSQASERCILAIGASTGGTEAIKTVLLGLPAQIPPTVIVQHMPPTFTRYFAARLSELARFPVKEAEDGDLLRPGLALLAPGDFHMRVVDCGGGRWCIRLNKEPPMHSVRPAVDITMRSVAQLAGRSALGVILTGMGKDGAAGLMEMRTAGAHTIAQDEASCVVYGMPKAAVAIGAVAQVLPLKAIAAELVEQLRLR